MNKRGGQMQFVVSLVFLSLFVIALIGFGINFAKQNEAYTSVSQDSDVNTTYQVMYSGLNNMTDKNYQLYNATLETEPSGSSGIIQSAGQFALGMTDIIGVLKGAMDLAFSKIFGGGELGGILATTLIGLAVFVIAMLIIRTWLGRNPD